MPKKKLPGSVVVTIDEFGVVEKFLASLVVRLLDNFTILHNKIKPDSKKRLVFVFIFD